MCIHTHTHTHTYILVFNEYMWKTFLIGLSSFFTSPIFVLTLILLKNSFQHFVFNNISVTAPKFHICTEMLVWPCSLQLLFYVFPCFTVQSSKLQFIYFWLQLTLAVRHRRFTNQTDTYFFDFSPVRIINSSEGTFQSMVFAQVLLRIHYSNWYTCNGKWPTKY